MRNAWSLGYGFVARGVVGHVVILAGVGLLAPIVLQYAVLGEAVGTGGPATLGRARPELGPNAIAATLAIVVVSYVVQTGSYFASWRLGFGPERSLARALGYGLGAGLLALAVFALVGMAAALAAMPAGASGAPVLAVMIIAVPLLIAFAMFYTALAAALAAAVALLLIALMAYGMAAGDVGLAASMVGGSGGVVVMLLLFSVVLLWLAARLSCAAPLMAERRSLNLLAAVRDSWRLTWDEQWAILRYLALVGFGLALAVAAVAVAAGLGATALLDEPAAPNLELGATVLTLAASVPLAFVSVLVPAGIHLELRGSAPAAEVFA